MADYNTIQSNIKNHTNDDLTNYALFMGGMNVTNDVLSNYDPLRTGYNRLFMVRKPLFLDKTIPTKLNKFKHILEYGNTAVTGISDLTLETTQLTGGYVGKSFELPTKVSDGTNAITIKVYEFSGSPVREVLHSWINGMSDTMTGLSHYNGEDSLPRTQANQTAEFIYVATDNTGKNVEYACMLANCFPTTINLDVFNYNGGGEHNVVETDIPFSCVKYESVQINKVAKALIDRYKLMANSLNFYSGFEINDKTLGAAKGYDIKSGKMTTAAAKANTEKVDITVNG